MEAFGGSILKFYWQIHLGMCERTNVKSSSQLLANFTECKRTANRYPIRSDRTAIHTINHMDHSTERVLRTPINLRPPRVSCREVNTSHMESTRNYLSARHCTAPVTETEPVPDALPREIRAAKRGRDARLMLIRAAVRQVSRAQHDARVSPPVVQLQCSLSTE